MAAHIFPSKAALALALTTSAAFLAGTSGASANTQRFTLSVTTMRGVDQPIKVVAAGPIHGQGSVAAPKQASRHERLTLRFTNGTVRLDVRETYVAAHPNFRTCTATIIGRGTFKITGGSGAFRGAIGAGSFNRRSTIIGYRRPNGACAGKTTPPKSVHTTSTFTGKAALPAA